MLHTPETSGVAFLVAIASLVGSTTGCQSHNTKADPKDRIGFRATVSDLVSQEQWGKAASYLNSADVEQAVDDALLRGDARWLGLQGTQLLVPEVQDRLPLPATYSNVWIFPGTSDVVFSSAFQDAAYIFARNYNRELLKRLCDCENTTQLPM